MRKLILVLLLLPFTLLAEPTLTEPGFEDWCIEKINDKYRECLRKAETEAKRKACREARDENEELCSTNMAI